MASKKKLKKEIERLTSDLRLISSGSAAWQRAAEGSKIESRMWRKKYELSQLTPEVKADTEAAFKRGATFARGVMLNNIKEMMTNIPTEEPTNV